MKRRALLIGVESYPNLDPRFRLHGCVNDVRLMERILQDHFAFPAADITTLVEEEATREGILRALDELTAGTDEGDVVVLHFSGHGSQMTDREGDEPDGRDETIVPYDSARRPKPNRDITDDELFVRLQQLAKRTTNVTLVFDCCHSGTVTRDAFGGADRWVPADDRPVEELPPSAVDPGAVRGATRDLGPSGWLPVGRRYVLIAGCRDEESSCEHPVAEEGATVVHGALTYFLSRELARAQPGTTYRDVFERASAQVSAIYPRQHPQMEGTPERELLGTREIVPLRFVGVSSREGPEVTLAAGAAHGMAGGSEWAVHPQGTKEVVASTRRLGLVRVERVGPVASTATVVEEDEREAISAGARAVEVAHAYGEMRLAVEVVAPDPLGDDARMLGRAIDESMLLRSPEPSRRADFRAYLLLARPAVGPEDPVPQLGPLAVDTWAVVGGEGRLAMPPHPRTEPGVVALLRDNLERLARYRHALALRNPDPDAELLGKVDLVLKRRSPEGQWVQATPNETGGQVVFEEGEAIAIDVVNHHDAPVYVSVLDFGLTGAVGPVHPYGRPSERLDAGRRITVGERAGEEMVLAVPEGFPFVREPDEPEPSGGVETFKLFVTAAEADFSGLFQEGVRSLGGDSGRADPLSQLLALALTGRGTRDVARPTRGAGEEAWMTLERPFFLRRKRT